MSPIEHEEHIGYDRFIDNVERAEAFLADAVGSAADHSSASSATASSSWPSATRAHCPRGTGATRADYYRWARGLPTAAELRGRASMILYGAAEASAITGGLVEEVEA